MVLCWCAENCIGALVYRYGTDVCTSVVLSVAHLTFESIYLHICALYICAFGNCVFARSAKMHLSILWHLCICEFVFVHFTTSALEHFVHLSICAFEHLQHLSLCIYFTTTYVPALVSVSRFELQTLARVLLATTPPVPSESTSIAFCVPCERSCAHGRSPLSDAFAVPTGVA